MPRKYVLALDEGSSSARAVLVDEQGELVSEAAIPIRALYPHPGWVELDPETLWQAAKSAIDAVMQKGTVTALDIAAVGVTSHRETCMIWDRSSGHPVYNAVMWMSKQTDDIVARWSAKGMDDEIRLRTGLRNDSYFSAAKLAWILENVPGVRDAATNGTLAAGTVDTWLLWKLTGGESHRTDPSAASRTAMFNIHTNSWDQELCAMYGIPLGLLPEVVASNSCFGHVDSALLERGSEAAVPVMAMLGDQQAGLYGQGCIGAGAAKNTYGTAGVLTVNVGAHPVIIDGMTSSVAWKVDAETVYEVEGVVFHSGQTLQWLRDNMRLIDSIESSESLAQSVPDNGGVYFVPAFAGLCDPYWDRNVRGAIFGLTLDTGAAHVVRAGLEAMAYQTRDNVDALASGGIGALSLKVDGGAIANDFLCQFQADILGIPVERPHGLERTAVGAARLAGTGVGLWNGTSDLASSWRLERLFEPHISSDHREALYDGWKQAVACARTLPARKMAGSHAIK
ncbi:glycerol kinase GlpK [Salinibacterium sp.]|uniref:FGGY family carbohydrate kinase n=1 Tax=Salinibacterium sp. TaxID=1915057 RepID=UPI00286C22A6|nr:glycerol kinase GlpK [Salinibacterium sp.]